MFHGRIYASHGLNELTRIKDGTSDAQGYGTLERVPWYVAYFLEYRPNTVSSYFIENQQKITLRSSITCDISRRIQNLVY